MQFTRDHTTSMFTRTGHPDRANRLVRYMLCSVVAFVPNTMSDMMPLYRDLGDHRYAITTANPLAQRYFDQGMRLAWALERAEARRSFATAEQLDPACAMCAWGVAWMLRTESMARQLDHQSALVRTGVLPEVIDWPDSIVSASERSVDVRESLANDALLRAQRRTRRLSPREAALIRATAESFAPDVTRAESWNRYATALGQLAATFHDDDELRVLHAEARLVARGSSLWPLSSRANVRTSISLGSDLRTAQTDLERVLTRSPSHPGACLLLVHLHYWMSPERAVDCSERLVEHTPRLARATLLQNSLYIRTGKYRESVRAGERALRYIESDVNDSVSFALLGTDAHTRAAMLHTHAYAALMSGQKRIALRSAREASRIAAGLPRHEQLCESSLVLATTTLAAFGEWNAVLAEPIPSSATPFARALAMYARGVAFAAKRRTYDAELALGALRDLARRVPTALQRDMIRIADYALQGEIALRLSRPSIAVTHFERAARVQDRIAPHEALVWPYPVRQSLGMAMLAAGRARDAERVYLDDLEQHPENGWSLLGLAFSLHAQRRIDEARRVQERFATAFADTDVTIPGSRY
jgi:tetratricopeptide (TPR) repeat protein